LISEFHPLSRAVVELMASFQITPHGVEKGDQRELHLEACILSRKGKKAGRCTAAYIPGILVRSKPYNRDSLEVFFQPPDEGGREG